MKVLPPIRAAFSMIQGTCPASPEAVSAPRYATTPKSVQISRYAPTKIQVDTEGRLELCLSRWTRAKTRFIEAVVGNIIAIIMTTQIARNTVAPIPIVKPMPILFIMRDCQIRITHDAAARISSSARKSGCARCKRMVLPLTVTEPRPKGTAVPKPGVRARSPRICRGALIIVLFLCVSMVSLAVVLVVAAPPEAGLVATEWRAVEPLVHAPEDVQPALVRRVGVVYDAILERERAHAGPFSPVRRPVRSNARRDLGERWTLLAGLRRPHVHRAEVVLDDSRLLLLLGVRHLEVVVEVAAERRRPGEAPAHPLLVRLQFRKRSPRHRAERDVVIGEVDDGAIEAVGDRRAGRAPCGVLGPEHEVIDEQLRASFEQIGQRHRALVGLEAVLLVDADPGQFLPPPRQFVAAPRQLLLGLEQLQPGRKPLFTCSGLVIGHSFSPSCRDILVVPTVNPNSTWDLL